MKAILLLAAVLLPQAARTGVSAWETGSSPADGPDARPEWTLLSSAAPALKGDGVMTNGRLTVVVRRQSASVDVYAGSALRSRLSLNAGTLTKVALVEISKTGACLEATYGTATAKFRLKRGEIFVETEPGPGAEKLQVASPGRYVVLPDFFADDMLVDATKIPPASVELPSENFLLQPTAGGDSLVMVVFENREQEVRVSLSGQGDQRMFTASEIQFGKGRKIWTAVMEGKGIWHAFDVPASAAGKISPLGWTMPFPAQWRSDFTRSDGLTDSWEMLLQSKKDGEYTKPSWLGNDDRTLPLHRTRWIELLGQFQYPLWSDHEGKGYVQPMGHKYCTMAGPAFLYPINRVKETPGDRYTALDVMRSTLGVGPCEYILDVEGQKEKQKGSYTCHVRDRLSEIYEKGSQKGKKDEIEKLLGEALTFVEHIRSRIEAYIVFGKEIKGFIAEKRKANPDLAAALGDLEGIAAQIEERLADRRDRIKAPSDVMELNDGFRKNVRDYEGPDLKDRLKKYTDDLTKIGGNQDKLVMECRWIVKALRQKAGLLMALDPRVAPVAEEVRAKTQAILRSPTAHEKARH